ncbi:hypothetical protein EDB80DRAFT_866807 [Ilyonectria destructans]|nr:hypothetical protein EDB80DRAFT_866807 [Ilyonectria destructans]
MTRFLKTGKARLATLRSGSFSAMFRTRLVAVIWREAGPESDELKRVYKIETTRPSSCKLGALDFINDYKFVIPIERLVQDWRAAQKPVYRCVVDEPNPWQLSNGAHHAVDLILLFGGFDHLIDGVAKRTGKEM